MPKKIGKMNEFQLIQRYFREAAELQLLSPDTGVLQGIGDDCALLQIPKGAMALSVDTLVAGVHFPESATAGDIAERALCTALSDLAAAGAKPLWFTLALTLPKNSIYTSADWLKNFSDALFRRANKHQIVLVGGDTTSGPLSVSIQVMGEVEPQQALRRDSANAGDFVCVTNFIGDGAAALPLVLGQQSFDGTHADYLRDRFYRPEPRFTESKYIQKLASAALDISDGLVADLNHICEESDLGAVIFVDDLPISPAVQAVASIEQQRLWALTGGDDYELCFTVSPEKMPELAMLIAQGKLQAAVVGEMVQGAGVVCELNGEIYSLAKQGYQHF